MTDNQLRELINELKSRNNNEDAYIGFHRYGGGTDESYIKANRQGLELHAAELLEAALETDTEFEKGRRKTFGLDEDLGDDQSEIGLHYVELKKEMRKEILPDSEYKETWKDSLLKYGMIGVGILFIAVLIIGIITVIKWLV